MLSKLCKQNYTYNQKTIQTTNMSAMPVEDFNIHALDRFKEPMEKERMSLTCAPGGENNRGMEIIGRMPIKGEGFTSNDIEGLGPYFKTRSFCYTDEDRQKVVAVLDLNALSFDDKVDALDDEDQARVLILRNWCWNWHIFGEKGERTMPDQDNDVKDARRLKSLYAVRLIYDEIAPIRWDAEYLDPNKYRTEIVDGEEVKVRGKPMNKRARTNLCFVAGREQKPAVLEGKGTIYDLKKMTVLNKTVERLREDIATGLIAIGSKTKVIINVVEGNRYYDLKTTGIGFHGDTERVVVICISIGGFNYPMRWQWFKDGMPVGKSIDIYLNSGDIYIMSEKAVGADWKKSSIYTLRHSAGAKKYRDLSKWEKKRPAYEARLARKAKIKAVLNKVKEQQATAKVAAKALKVEKAAAAKAAKVKVNDKKNKGKATKGGSLKIVSPADDLEKRYKNALKTHDWQDNDASFYRWIAIEADHACSHNFKLFKEFLAIWTGKNLDSFDKMDMNVWEENRAVYRNLCAYRVFW